MWLINCLYCAYPPKFTPASNFDREAVIFSSHSSFTQDSFISWMQHLPSPSFSWSRYLTLLPWDLDYRVELHQLSRWWNGMTKRSRTCSVPYTRSWLHRIYRRIRRTPSWLKVSKSYFIINIYSMFQVIQTTVRQKLLRTLPCSIGQRLTPNAVVNENGHEVNWNAIR